MNKTSSEKLFLKNFPMCSRDEHIGVYDRFQRATEGGASI